MQQTLFLMLGPPGSGKTHIATRLAKDLKAIHLNADALRYSLFETPDFSLEESRIVYTCLDHFAEKLLKAGQSVIYDANNNNRAQRAQREAIATKHGANYRLLFVTVPEKLAVERITTRGDIKNTDPQYPRLAAEVYYRLLDNMEGPGSGEATIYLDGTAAYAISLEKVIGDIMQTVPTTTDGVFL